MGDNKMTPSQGWADDQLAEQMRGFYEALGDVPQYTQHRAVVDTIRAIMARATEHPEDTDADRKRQLYIISHLSREALLLLGEKA